MIARVTLEIALRKEFDYLIPQELAAQVAVGSRVKVPFGRREVLGCVTALSDDSSHPKIKLRPILRIVGGVTLVTPGILRLSRWIGDYYCCSPETALKSVLPEAVRKEKQGWKERLMVRVLPAPSSPPRLTAKQATLLAFLQGQKEIAVQDAVRLAKASPAMLRRLEDRGLVEISGQIDERDPYAREVILPTTPLALNVDQTKAVERIKDALNVLPKTDAHPGESTPSATTFLLHGVTGSGKTEVYLQTIAHALSLERGAIVLVPEISLTPQTVERFKARFSGGPHKTLVAVLHSHLSAGERHDEWHKIRQGRARIVIGARSAIFAPVKALGLIIVDEEHEQSYKQEEAPRYHARDVAVIRASMENAVTVLGSATPSLESYYNAQKGKYALLEMPTRADDKKMPIVRVVDMRQAARKEKGTPIFSPQLKEAITRRLERKEQTILFLNRRGFATSLQCPKCGYVAQCPNCSVSLTYHRQIQQLCCHICGYHATAPTVCPDVKCRNPEIRYSGLGTEKVEATLVRLFPHARIRRMDSDTLKRKEDYRKVLGDFKTGKIDILVGTQMIAKGLHFPNVTLVGIIYADLSLHIPDFRAGERTFQLLTQVAGRAGRGDVEGEVLVQAFTPFHPAIQYARRHDFAGFFEQEIEFRQQLKYPPLGRVALITLKSRNEDKAKFSAEHLKRELEKDLSEIRDLVISGPAAAPLARAETQYRYQVLLRTPQMTRLSRKLAETLQRVSFPEDVTVSPDIDPVNLF